MCYSKFENVELALDSGGKVGYSFIRCERKNSATYNTFHPNIVLHFVCDIQDISMYGKFMVSFHM